MSKVLLVDDDRELSCLYEELLTDAGYQVEIALDGQSALTKIAAGGYDLVLLDIMMPKIDGLEVLRRIKALNLAPNNGPVVILSALDQNKITNEAKSLGAAGFMHKPELTPDQFLEEVKKYII